MVTGESLLTGNGEFWQRQRRLLQPAFHHHNIARFADQMTAATAAMLERWRQRTAHGETLDVASEMMRLTYTVVGRTLFSADVGPDAEDPADPPDRTADAVQQATLLLAEGLTRREVVRRLSETLGLSRNDAYRLVMELPG